MRKRTFGQAMVEFALVFPILLAVILAIIDGAFIFQGYITVSHAAREAARFAVVYQPPQGECLDGVVAPWPACPGDPSNYGPNPTESDDDYYERRVELIKDVAFEEARGLRTDPSFECKESSCIDLGEDTPGMLGVSVWGFMSFDAAEEPDKPGLPGLPVKVMVEHNVPLVVFGSFIPNAMVHVSSDASMINEGIQVGFGNQAPPTFSPASGGALPPGTALPTRTPAPSPTAGPSPTPTPRPVYNVDLTPKDATNLLPDEREHPLDVHVTDNLGRDVAGAQVSLSTDYGSFQKSGAPSGSLANITTGADGRARPVIYANEPVTASITAWLDYDGNTLVGAEEPADTARKIWDAFGPYLIVSNHNPVPEETIGVQVVDHPDDTYDLWWCPDWVTSTQIIQLLGTTVVDGGTPIPDVSVEVPIGSAGSYRIKSYPQGSSLTPCTDEPESLRGAISAPIEIAEVPPNLIITDVALVEPDGIAPGLPITFTVTISNASVAAATGPFDLDTYLDLDEPGPHPQQLGESKQWIDSLGPRAQTVITNVVTVYTAEDHVLWLQVDTTNYVDEGEEGGETDNVAGPIPLPMTDCIPIMEDDFSSGMGKWQHAEDIGDQSPSGSQVANGQLQVTPNRGDIYNNSDSFRYIYNTIQGDFRMTIRLVDTLSEHEWAKSGLMARESANANSRNVYFYYPEGTERLTLSYRRNTGSSTNRIFQYFPDSPAPPPPIHLRLEREGNEFTGSYSMDGESWTTLGSETNTPLPIDSEILVGIASCSHDSGDIGPAIYEDFEICRPTGISSATPPPAEVLYPPGLTQCDELLRVTGFEGNPATVFSYWKAGDTNGLVGAYQRTSAEFFRGSFSLRLHASNSVLPCSSNQLQPYLYQDVEIPTEVFTHSTLTVDGRYRIAGSVFECSEQDSPDAGDVLSLGLSRTSGDTIVAPQALINGGAQVGTWHQETASLHDDITNLPALAGDTLRLQWSASNNTNNLGTFFYIDQVSAQLCSSWPTPEEQDGTATIGGRVTTRGENNVPTAMPGAHVWAYTQGGAVLQTRAIQDGTYHFYNKPAGTYIIYAEAWVGGELRTVSTSVTVNANERNHSVNLLLQ